MKVNGFLALGIVLMLLGGVSMLEIIDATPPYTPLSTEPSKPSDVTLIFMATGGIAIVYGFVKQKKVKT